LAADPPARIFQIEPSRPKSDAQTSVRAIGSAPPANACGSDPAARKIWGLSVSLADSAGLGELRLIKLGHQTTIRDRVSISGFGVHSNAPVNLVLHPADANSGIVFLRTGLPGGRERLIEAKWSNVTQTELCTVLGDSSRASVSTVEHLLAACAGLNIDNLMIEIDGPEAPIMDGSAAAFVAAIDQVGMVAQARPRRHLKVLKTVRVERGRSFAELRPADRGFHLDIEIDFAAAAIGRQRRAFDIDPVSFRSEVARARTFGFISDVERLWKMGFALGSSLENSVALDGDRVVNPEGLRFADEFVRHKALDAVGDLSLGGAAIVGAYRSYMPGHKMNFLALEALFADRNAYEFVEAPVRREFTGARAGTGGLALATYAPEVD
jgi:UDP-3-O-[3-hydroxymyristoyl] N-acetylglucosamine deacetylase